MRVGDLVNEGKREEEKYLLPEGRASARGVNHVLDLEVSEEKLRAAGWCKIPSEEQIRLFLITPLAEFIIDWNNRPKFGKGSDRSDLVSVVAKSIIKYLGEKR